MAQTADVPSTSLVDAGRAALGRHEWRVAFDALMDGVPVAAAVGRTNLFSSLDYGEASDTWSANPLCCAAAIGVSSNGVHSGTSSSHPVAGTRSGVATPTRA